MKKLAVAVVATVSLLLGSLAITQDASAAVAGKHHAKTQVVAGKHMVKAAGKKHASAHHRKGHNSKLASHRHAK